MDKNKAKKILEKLETAYPDAKCALDHENAFQLLVAVSLSAQTTDVSVNKITPALFAAYKTPRDLAAARTEDVEQLIHSIGLYKTKSKRIIEQAKMLVDCYDGEVPESDAELCKLPGVGRKTANVVMSVAFGHQRIAVDTHVFRVSNRIGLAHGKDVLETELQLLDLLPKNMYTRAHHLLIFHGRNCCTARKPDCANCPIGQECEYNEKAL